MQKRKSKFFLDSPFDEAKYRALLDGLEISIINFKNLDKKNLIFGAEFYSKYKLEALNKLKDTFKINDFFKIKNETISTIDNKVILYDLTHSIGNFLIDSEIVNEINSNKKVAEKNNFVISRLRSYLKEMAVVEHKSYKQLFSTEYLIYENINSKFNSNSLLAFSLTKYVQTILNKSQYGTEHPRFYEFVFEDINIPNRVLKLNSNLTDLINKSHIKLEESKILYKEAEELLLKELDLIDFKPNKENIAIKSFSESFGTTGRLDSEYYQPKYEEIIEKIKSYKGGFETLKDLTKSYSGGYACSSDDYLEKGELALIRINNIKTGYLDLSNAIFLPDEYKNLSKKDVAKENDILISMSGSIGLSCKIEKHINAIVNQRILKIEIKNFSNDVLVLILNSIISSMQLERIGTGGVQTNISSSDILDILIPIIDSSIQTQIEEKIKKSFDLKEESKRLLDLAKKAVEMAIEKDEDEAMEIIQGDTI